MRPLVSIFDVTTQETNIREMNDEEYNQSLIDKAEADKIKAESDAKQAEIDAAKAAVSAKLAELGLDEETLKTIARLY